MSTPVHVTVDINECGELGSIAIGRAIDKALDQLPIDTVLRIDTVTFIRPTTPAIPAARAGDVKKLEAVEQLAHQLKDNPIPGAIGLASQMLASRLLEIVRGDI